MVSESNERRTLHKGAAKTYSVPEVTQRRLELFGHICKINDSRKVKSAVFGIVDGKNNIGKPRREWDGAKLPTRAHPLDTRQN